MPRAFAIALALIAGFGLGVAVGYSQFAVPLENKLEQAAVYATGCELIKDLFVPAKYKPGREQFMLKQPNPLLR